MSANRRRGEISGELDGTEYRLCLTLGALAELEAAYAADDLGALVDRFSSGRLSARDMIRIIAAGLRGAGNDVSDDQVGAMRSAGGAAGFAAIVADLLTTTFGAAPEKRGRGKPLNAAVGGASEFPWDAVMAAGFGLLRLSPKTFWSMTPRELERAMSVLPRGREAPPRRAELSALMRAYPDKQRTEE